MMQFAPAFLLLALSLSWPRFATIFRSGVDSRLVQSPATMAASAISIASLGLAIADQGLAIGALLVVTGILVSRYALRNASLFSVATACISLGLYLQIAGRIG